MMDSSANKKQWLLWTSLGVILVGVGLYALNGWLRSQELRKPTTQMADYGVAPSFSLTDQNARGFTSNNLKGHIWIADMIFTHCTGSCPIMTAKMVSIEKSLVKTPQVHLVSFSVDPDRDTPEALRLYAKNYGADTTQWSFLTGTRADIFALAKTGFHLPVDSVGGDQGSPIVHSERIVLVDAKGHIRGYFDGGEDDIQPKILTAIGDLMREGEQS